MVAVLMFKGDAACLEGDAAGMQLETLLFQMTPSAAQLADMYQRAVLDLVPTALAPQAFVAQLLIRVVPQAVNCGFDVADLLYMHVRHRGGEGVCDVVAETAITVGVGEALHQMGKVEPFIRELFPQICNLTCVTDDFSPLRTVADHLGPEHVVALLSHCPVDAVRVRLMVSKEKLLPAVQGSTGELVGTGMQVLGMDGAAMPAGAQ